MENELGAPSVLASWTRYVLAGAAACGFDAAALAAQAGIDERALTAPDARVPFAKHRQLWSLLETLGGSPELGVRMAETPFSPSDLEISGFILRSCATLGELLDKLTRYLVLINDNDGPFFRVEGDQVVLGGDDNFGIPIHRYSMEHSFATYVNLARRWLDRPVHVGRLDLIYPRPNDLAPYRRVFGDNVLFARPHNALRFSAAYLDYPLVGSEPRLADYLVPQAEAQLAQRRGGPLVAALRAAIAEALPRGQCDAHAMSRALRLSRRTLQRRLKDLGTTFRAVVDDTRREVAMGQLRDGRASIMQCAQATGYANAAAFTRAFVRWANSTPEQYRRECLETRRKS